MNKRYENAYAETLEYLKGIRQADIDKIPKKFIEFIKQHASKDYICNFDYNKPLNEIELLDETRGIISLICLNYWCETKEQKYSYLLKLRENEIKREEKARELYNPNDIFTKNNKIKEQERKQICLPKVRKNSVIKRIIIKIKSIFGLT